MAQEKNGHVLQLWEVHEERIQQIEHDRVTIASQIADQTATLRAIKEDINDLAANGRDANKTLNQLAGSIQILVKQDNSRFKALEAHHPPTVSKLEEIWAQWWGKVMFSALTVGGGALFSLVMEHFKNHS